MSAREWADYSRFYGHNAMGQKRSLLGGIQTITLAEGHAFIEAGDPDRGWKTLAKRETRFGLPTKFWLEAPVEGNGRRNIPASTVLVIVDIE